MPEALAHCRYVLLRLFCESCSLLFCSAPRYLSFSKTVGLRLLFPLEYFSRQGAQFLTDARFCPLRVVPVPSSIGSGGSCDCQTGETAKIFTKRGFFFAEVSTEYRSLFNSGISEDDIRAKEFAGYDESTWLPVVTSQHDRGSQLARRVDERRKILETFHSPAQFLSFKVASTLQRRQLDQQREV